MGRARPGDLRQHRVLLLLGVGVFNPPPLLNSIERRLGDVEIALVDQRPHPAVHEGQDQGADVGSVNIGVGHDDDLVITGLLGLELLPFPRADGRDQRLDLVVAQDLVRLVQHPLHVQDLALQGQDGLKVPVAAHLGRPAGRFALHDVQLR